MLSRTTLAILALLITLVPFAGMAQTPPPLPLIKVGIIPVEGGAEPFYAEDMGFFRQQGLNVELQIMQNGAAIAAAVASGSLDVGFADTISIAAAHARGFPFVYLVPALINSYTAPALAVLVAGNGTIRGPKDFNNKTIAVNGLNNITMLPFEAWIDNSGGDSKTVKWVEVPITTANDAVSSGKVDAATTGEPFISFGVDNGLRAIYVDKNGIASRYVLAGFMTTKDWAARNPLLATKFTAAIKEAAQWANGNREGSAQILSRYTKIPLPVVERMKRGELAVDLRSSDFQPVIDAAAKYGIVPKAYPASELFYRPGP
jgi:NitT/TauT family transport system substrate-binding protein